MSATADVTVAVASTGPTENVVSVGYEALASHEPWIWLSVTGSAVVVSP